MLFYFRLGLQVFDFEILFFGFKSLFMCFFGWTKNFPVSGLHFWVSNPCSCVFPVEQRIFRFRDFIFRFQISIYRFFWFNKEFSGFEIPFFGFGLRAGVGGGGLNNNPTPSSLNSAPLYYIPYVFYNNITRVRRGL